MNEIVSDDGHQEGNPVVITDHYVPKNVSSESKKFAFKIFVRLQEELFGLSSGAIDRWIGANRLDGDSALVKLIRKAADKLFFLSNKSQEQVTEDYKLLSREVSALTAQIKRIVIESY